MSEFKQLIQIQRAADTTHPAKGRGCDFCPLDNKKGINKIMGKVRGRKIFLWAQSPGPKENKKRKELIGPSGEFLWYELKKNAGIERDDVDIQNVVRCLPADYRPNVYPSLVMRAPSKIEIKCCSIYNEQALEHSKARLHLVFGKIAAQAVLGKDFKANKRIFYSEKMKAWVVYLDHPSFFIRQGFRAGDHKNPSASLKRLREDLRHAKTLLHNKSDDRFAFIKSLDSRGVVTRKQAYAAYNELKHDGLKGHRLVFDMEEGRVDKHGNPDDNGKSIALVCGIQARKDGPSYTFALDAPLCPASTRCRNLNHKLVKKLLSDSRLKKAAHYAASDYNAVERLLHYRVHGLDYDTQIGDFFRDPNVKAYGLEKITDRSYPDFAGYKDIRYPEAMTEAYAEVMEKKKLSPEHKIELAEKRNKLNLARLPWKKMVWYNGADCHIEKIIEQDTLKTTSQPLMKVYVDSGHVLYRMQTERDCQPSFDYKWHKRIAAFYNEQMSLVRKEIRKRVGKYITIRTKWQTDNPGKKVKRKFNPNSRDQLKYYLVKKLKILPKDGNTKASTLKELTRRYPKIKEPGLFLRQSSLKKRISTYIVSYKNCADLNEAHLRTNWKQTGTSTGRLSSGKTKERSDDNVINLQNVDGEPFVQCLIISDIRWWDIYRYWQEHGDFDSHTWKQFQDVDVMLGYDFSQNELRQLAEESGDKELQRIFASKEKWHCDKCGNWHLPDPHVEVGHALTGWSKGLIAHNDRFRKLVKNMQFGLVYGLQGEGLFRFLVMLGVKTTLEEVNKYHRKYFKRFPGVAKLQKYYRKMAEDTRAVTNVFGFTRKLNVQEQKEANPDEEREGGWWGNQAINCVDFKTEALTQRGWVQGKQLQAGDVCLTYNQKKDVLEWQSATDVKVFPHYRGKVYKFTSKSFSALTTPDHRWTTYYGKEFTSQTMPKHVSLPRVKPYMGPSKSNYSDDFIRLIGWTLTDGSYGRRCNTIDRQARATSISGWSGNSVYVCQSKPKNVKRIDKLFGRLREDSGLHYRTKLLKNRRGAYDEVFWSFSGTFGRWFKGVFPHRILTPEFLTQLPLHQLKILFRTMLRGDGFLCRSKKGIDAYQMLAYLCGRASTVRYRDMSKYIPISDKMPNIPKMTGIWGGKILKREKISFNWVKTKIETRKTGMWCPIVPNTFFVARRKGTVYITGNTPIQGASHQLLLMSVAAVHRKPKKYKILRYPVMEVHDALYNRIKLKYLLRGVELGKDLMMKEPVEIIKHDFNLKKRVPLSAEPKAGFRFGVQVKGLGDSIKTEWDFLNQWCKENQILHNAYAWCATNKKPAFDDYTDHLAEAN